MLKTVLENTLLIHFDYVKSCLIVSLYNACCFYNYFVSSNDPIYDSK